VAKETRDTIAKFMSTITGREITEEEQDCPFNTLATGYTIISDSAIDRDRWKNFPEKPHIGIETDPGEVID